MNYNKINVITGWAVWFIATLVYFLSAEPTGSLWDCGEFISAAYKLQVVHPPGAPLFLMVGRMFAIVGEALGSGPETIAFAVNFMSGLCTSFSVLFGFWVTTALAKIAFVGEERDPTSSETIALMGAGVASGLAATFATSIWFSAVEGEVYAMSLFFIAIVFWATMKWYGIKEDAQADRWLIFIALMIGLSIGVHLLSLLAIPALAMIYYYKKTNHPTLKGTALSFIAGFGVLVLVNFILIPKLPTIGSYVDYFFVMSLGLPIWSGMFFFILLLAGLCVAGVLYSQKKNYPNLQRAVLAFSMILISFSTYGLVVLRAQANPPINMNDPEDPFSLVSYLNREQYGERPLFYGPHFQASPYAYKQPPGEKIGQVGDEYAVVSKKIEYKYYDKDMMFLPRMGFPDRKRQYKVWRNGDESTPGQIDNLGFLFRYQIGWMYWRYFMWNFTGRQNGTQGWNSKDKSDGHWLSGLSFVDNNRLYDQSKMPTSMKENQARNTYFFLPFLFGFIGMFWHYRKSPHWAAMVTFMFLLTGLAIIFFANSPPQEPRERDYVFAGSILTFCIWIGMAVMAGYELLKKYVPSNNGLVAAGLASALVLTAPVIMGFQNWDDHSRADQYASRDYANNFLESCAKDAIIFTHGDNDTYPLWYAQEVENIRTDVRVVNLSLLAVDWYVEQLRYSMNESPAIKMSIPQSGYRGDTRNSMEVISVDGKNSPMGIQQAVKFMSESHRGSTKDNQQVSYYVPSKNLVIPVNRQTVLGNGTVSSRDADRIESQIPVTLNKRRIIKDEVAMLDIIASNNWERPIYFAVTCRPDKLLGLGDYFQLEGLGLRLTPVKNASDKTLGVIGTGGVNVDVMYDNMMNKFKWGNFDKEKLFVNHSYGPSVQSHQLAFLRLAKVLRTSGDTERAVKVLDKYMEVFPNKNFPYDFQTVNILNEYAQNGQLDKVKDQILQLAKNTAEYLEFFESLGPRETAASFGMEANRYFQSVKPTVLQYAERLTDEKYKTEITNLLGKFTKPPIPSSRKVPG